MASFPLSALTKKACDMEEQRFRAMHVWLRRLGAAALTIGLVKNSGFLAENGLSCNVFVPCLLPQLLAHSALQKTFGRWRDVAQPLVPICLNSQAGVLHKHLPQMVDGP